MTDHVPLLVPFVGGDPFHLGDPDGRVRVRLALPGVRRVTLTAKLPRQAVLTRLLLLQLGKSSNDALLMVRELHVDGGPNVLPHAALASDVFDKGYQLPPATLHEGATVELVLVAVGEVGDVLSCSPVLQVTPC